MTRGWVASSQGGGSLHTALSVGMGDGHLDVGLVKDMLSIAGKCYNARTFFSSGRVSVMNIGIIAW